MPLAQQRVAERISARNLTAVARAVVGKGDVALVQQLVHEAGRVVLAARVRDEAHIRTAIFLGREISVENIGVANAQHKSVLSYGVLFLRLLL